MLIKKPDDIKSGEITDRKLYVARRTFVRGAILAATTATTGLLYRKFLVPARPKGAPPAGPAAPPAPAVFDVAGEARTSFEDITHYNNFYEFSTDKREVAEVAKGFVTRPWTVSIEGLVHKPRVVDLDDLAKIAPAEERVYRHRCVEAWSMVIPWLGFPLASLIEKVQPMSNARYVQFETLLDPKQMPLQRTGLLEWPYVEGLRIDEAMHPLAFLATGLYGQPLLPQNGAPFRLVVPWKYGFKSCKSIVRIRFVEEQPPTTWNLAGPDEYGFYSNVNPEVSHPRWSQAKERRIGEFDKRDTLMFNGYAEQVAHLYSGMDLKVNY